MNKQSKTVFTSALMIVMIALAMSCTQAHSNNISMDTPPKIPQIEIEGCQYFYEVNNGVFFLVHKGNCKNPIHCHNKPDSTGANK